MRFWPPQTCICWTVLFFLFSPSVFLLNIALHHTFVSWVKHPQFLDLMYTTRLVSVMVDPTSLPPGVHSAYVKGYDTACPDKGAIFEIPIHVVIPGRMVSKVVVIYCLGERAH